MYSSSSEGEDEDEDEERKKVADPSTEATPAPEIDTTAALTDSTEPAHGDDAAEEEIVSQ